MDTVDREIEKRLRQKLHFQNITVSARALKNGACPKYEEAAPSVDRHSHTFRDKNKINITKQDEPKTDHFLSGRILLNFDSQSSIFLKIPSTGDEPKNMNPTSMHYREIFMYENVLPKLFEFRNGQRYAPLCHAVTENKGLVLEDLEARGYRVYDSKRQLDLEHCHVALTTLAKYHALSAKYVRDNSCVLGDVLAQMPDYDPDLVAFCCELYSRFLGLAKALVPTPAHRKLCEYTEVLETKFAAVCETNDSSSGLSVIAHGNFSAYNILFKYERGRVREAKMVNWQTSRKASAVWDLIYFFVSSVRFEVFEAHRDALLNLYVDTLNERLSALKCSCRYSRADLDADLDKCKMLFPVFAGCILQIIMTATESQGCCFRPTNELAPNNYTSLVAKWLDYFVENGIV